MLVSAHTPLALTPIRFMSEISAGLLAGKRLLGKIDLSILRLLHGVSTTGFGVATAGDVLTIRGVASFAFAKMPGDVAFH